jgi:uncharacterized protein YcnI
MKTKLLILAILVPGLAHAQVKLEQNQAESGSYYKGVLTVTQGCDGSATTAISVDIPEGLQFAQPMPKAGWQVEIVKKPVERPFFRDGIEITEAVRQITWSGNSLHDIHFDEFIFRGRIGVGATSVLYFPVTQKCETGELHWDQIAEEKPVKKTMPKGPIAVKDLMEDLDERDEDQSDQQKSHQHKHGENMEEAEHAGEPKAHQHQHQHGQPMEMTENDVQIDHSLHSGHGGPSLQYPAPFVKVVDGTGEHHHH